VNKEINETLATYLKRIEDVDVKSDNGIILGRNVKIPVLLDGVKDDIVKTPIAWSLLDYKMFYLVNVPSNTVVEPHHHDESIFRILIKGDLKLNDIEIQEGEWFVVEAGTKYSIETQNGYLALSGYTSVCQTSRRTALHYEQLPMEK
jgi:hypothetical protein